MPRTSAKPYHLYQRKELRPKRRARAAKTISHLTWYVRYKCPITREWLRKSTDETDYEKAEEKARELTAVIKQVVAEPDTKTVTLQRAYEAMLTGGKVKLDKATRAQYEMHRDHTLALNDRAAFRGHAALDPYLPVADLKPAHLADLMSDRAEHGYSQRTIGYELTVLRRAVLYAVEYLEAPHPKVTKWRVPQGDMKTRYLSRRDLDLLLEELHPSRPVRAGGKTDKMFVPEVGSRLFRERQVAHDLALFLSHSGTRWGEASRFVWQQVDFERERLLVYGSKTRNTIPLREVPLHPRVREMLERRYAERDPKNPLVFPSADTGNAMVDPPNGIMKTLEEMGANRPEVVAQLGKLTTHGLRHTFASILRQNGVALDIIQKILGHRSAKMTERYAHIEPEHVLQRVRDVWDRAAA